MTERISGNVRSMPLSGIRKIFDAANQMQDVVHLEIGDPDFPTPPHIIDAAEKAARDGFTHYTATGGIPQLKEAVAAKFARDNGIECDPMTQTIVTVGAVGSIAFTCLAVVNPGDEVIVTDPSWPNYMGQIRLAGGIPVKLPLRQSAGFLPDLEELKAKITPRTKLLIINTPNNPCGSVFTKEVLLGIGEIALEHNILVLADEVYEKILYDGRTHFSLASDPRYRDHVVTVNGCSKTYAMTGWRCGFATGPKEMIAAMTKVMEASQSCVSSVVQMAALAALNGPQDCVDNMVSIYNRRRDLMVSGLSKIPEIKVLSPGGAFYVFPDISGFGMSSVDFAMTLLQEARVAVVHGSGLGDHGDTQARMAFCTSDELIGEAVTRIAKWAEGRRK